MVDDSMDMLLLYSMVLSLPIGTVYERKDKKKFEIALQAMTASGQERWLCQIACIASVDTNLQLRTLNSC